MRIEISHGQLGLKQDIIHILILLTITLCIGIYLVGTTVLIAIDGVTFIEYAKNLEADPVKTMVSEFQHPGYPFLILTAHRIAKIACSGSSLWSWIYSAQIVALVFRLLAVAVLYFVGKEIVGPKFSFLTVLILILLPGPAEYGSDALSDWPYLFFLVAGLLLIIKGAMTKRRWMFGLAGVIAGAGYLVRPECAQLVVLGCLWLGLQFFWPTHPMSRSKGLSALALLLVGFLVIAGPYMKLKGAIFPKKNVGQFAQASQQLEVDTDSNQTISEATHTWQFTPTNIAKAFYKLWQNIGETLMWFFVPALLIGMHNWFRARKWHQPECFFIIVLIVLNVLVMIWLYCRHGYISKRHTLPLVIFTLFYIPIGLLIIASWLQNRINKKAKQSSAINGNDRQPLLFVLLAIGIFVCAPKLLRPIRAEKQGYRAAAQWLKANTDSAAIVAVPDKRISFYAERGELVYENENIPEKAEYVVKIFKKQKDETALMESSGKVEYKYVDKKKRGVNVIVYKNL